MIPNLRVQLLDKVAKDSMDDEEVEDDSSEYTNKTQ